MTRVFVYGTLKRGGDNHHYIAYQQFLGEARTPAGYTLYSLGDYPGMVRAPEDTAGVTGELWAVDEACLKQLDLLEGVNEGLYERAPIKLASPSDGLPTETYLYLPSVIGRNAVGSTWEV
jgi:gamma-glutamylaminecyclotransferase